MINLVATFVTKCLLAKLLFLVFLPSVFSNQEIESSLRESTSTGIAEYLDLTQLGVAEEYEEYLQIGSQKGMAEARAQGINVNTGLDDSGEMMEGVLYVYGMKARQEDLHKRILIVFGLLLGVFLVKRQIR